jgi:hypothetical protein
MASKSDVPMKGPHRGQARDIPADHPGSKISTCFKLSTCSSAVTVLLVRKSAVKPRLLVTQE